MSVDNQKTILGAITDKKYKSVRTSLLKLNVADIAEILATLNEKDLIAIFRLLPQDISADVFTYMDNDKQLQIINAITDREIATIMDEIFLDDTIDFLEEMPSNVVKRVLKNSTPEERDLINKFLTYPENSAGSIMTIEYVSLKKENTVERALEIIRKNGVDKETINMCYVTSASRQLLGAVSIRSLILADPTTLIKDIMSTNVISASTHDDQEEIANVFNKYNLSTLPIVDSSKRIVGIITVDDVLDVVRQEATEDISIMAAVRPSEKPYLKESPLSHAKHRIIWLLVLMLSDTLAGSIIRGYEGILAQTAILASFMPMLMGTGGNAGGQVSALIVRGLALGEVRPRDVFKVWLKEIAVGFLLGAALAVVLFAKLWFFDRAVLGADITLTIAFVVCASIFITTIIAKIIGSSLPLIASKVGLDPAVMASPFITTLVDIVSLSIFFFLATQFIV